MAGSRARARTRRRAGFQGHSQTRAKAMIQAKTVAVAKLKTESVTQAKVGDGAVSKTQRSTQTEAVAMTREVSKMKDMTKTNVIPETDRKTVTRPRVVPQIKSQAMPGSSNGATTQSKVKTDAGNEVNISSCVKAADMTSIESRPQIREEAGNKANIRVKSNDKDEENVCSWLWTEKESSTESWFWSEEETPPQVYNPPPKINDKPELIPQRELTIRQKAAATWLRARYSVLVPIDVRELFLPPEGNWTLIETLTETPLGIKLLTKISPYSGPYFQPLAEIKHQIRYGEKYGPNPKNCRCKAYSISLEPREFERLVALLKLTEDPFIHEIATMVMGVSPAYPFTQDIIHDIGINVMVENLITNPNVKEHPRTLNIADDISESSEVSQMRASYVNQICKDIISYPLNSIVQLSGLKVLVNLSLKFPDHNIIIKYIPDILLLLNNGNAMTKIFILKVFSYLSKNQVNIRELISAEVLSSLVALFNKYESKFIILAIIETFENTNYQFKRGVKLFTKEQFSKDELISIFHEAKELSQKLHDLAEHNDTEVRDKIAQLILKL
ncbi:LOW QUALITY PROTEIN: armadillo repeat-containing X-linked protein 5 [Tenrec ecaudatus]|uniref:LOW QUALITY PROTEIN: armadillo repeat-containing X-linked protein 5 n=1 Tax=Tenrec ecaudatus TaxID=94439 RepID=UPI003F5978CD